MGCCTSSEASDPNVSSDRAATPSSAKKKSAEQQAPSKPRDMSSETGDATLSRVAGTPSVKTNAKPAPAQPAQAAPAPGVKNVRAAYSGKGWAPPQKEWDSTKKEKGDKTKIEIEDEWDDDGNLKRTIVKRITTPDWKFKTEKTVEVYSAEEAKKLGLGRK